MSLKKKKEKAEIKDLAKRIESNKVSSASLWLLVTLYHIILISNDYQAIKTTTL